MHSQFFPWVVLTLLGCGASLLLETASPKSAEMVCEAQGRHQFGGGDLRMGCSVCSESDSVTVVRRLSPGPKQKQECPLLLWFSEPRLGLGGPCSYVSELLGIRHSGPWTGFTLNRSCIELQVCLLLWTPSVQKSASKRSLHLGRKYRPGYAAGGCGNGMLWYTGQGGTRMVHMGIPWWFLEGKKNLTFQNDTNEVIYKPGRDSQI